MSSIGLLGEYEVTLDPKGRFMLPIKFKQLLTEQNEPCRFVLNRGFDQCLTLYTETQWKKVAEVVNKLNDFNEKARRFKRVFLNGATILEADSAGRILLPKPMIEYASILKDIIFFAQLNKTEIWNKQTYLQQTKADMNDMSDLGGEVLGNDFLNPFGGN